MATSDALAPVFECNAGVSSDISASGSGSRMSAMVYARERKVAYRLHADVQRGLSSYWQPLDVVFPFLPSPPSPCDCEQRRPLFSSRHRFARVRHHPNLVAIRGEAAAVMGMGILRSFVGA